MCSLSEWLPSSALQMVSGKTGGFFLYCRSGLSPTASTSASRPISSSSGATLPSQGCTGNALSLMKCNGWRAWLSGTGKPSSSCRGLTSLKCSVLSKSPSVLCSYLKILKLESLYTYINLVKRNFHLLCHSVLDLRQSSFVSPFLLRQGLTIKLWLAWALFVSQAGLCI